MFKIYLDSKKNRIEITDSNTKANVYELIHMKKMVQKKSAKIDDL